MKQHITTKHICIIAFAVVLNIVGGEIALLLHLPIYLDSIGTLFIAAVLGPYYGMLPHLLSGIIFGMLSDIYSLYYAPVGILLGLLAGNTWKKQHRHAGGLFKVALFITLPTSLLSASITACLFGGITSSGSTILIQLLAKTPLGLTLSCLIIQFFTDYIDRVVSLFLVSIFLKKVPISLWQKYQL